MNIHLLINKRVLIKDTDYSSRFNAMEVKILEVSPTGNWVKLQNLYGKKYWVPIQGIALIEVLQELEAGKPSEV